MVYTASLERDTRRENQNYSASIDSTHINYEKNNINPNKKKILLIDDEEDITIILRIGLEDNGFSVDTFNDPILALSNFKADVYDLVLLDIRMPKMNGFELFEKLREIDSNVKICFVTAYEEYYQSLKEAAPAIGFDCYIKPIDIDDLVSRVKAHVYP
jgi:DNA-binding response OmpR family regulator